MPKRYHHANHIHTFNGTYRTKYFTPMKRGRLKCARRIEDQTLPKQYKHKLKTQSKKRERKKRRAVFVLKIRPRSMARATPNGGGQHPHPPTNAQLTVKEGGWGGAGRGNGYCVKNVCTKPPWHCKWHDILWREEAAFCVFLFVSFLFCFLIFFCWFPTRRDMGVRDVRHTTARWFEN